MIIYSDIDEVIHDYIKPLYKALKSRYNIEIDDHSIPGEYDLKKPIMSTYGLSEKEFEDVIEYANSLEEWVPTSFSSHIIKFLKKRREKGDCVLFVTARTSRRGAKHIIKKAFGEDYPIIQCDSNNKKYVIRDESIFFEDRGDTIEACAEENPKSLIIAPEWPWNSYLKEKSFDNVKILPQDCFEAYLEKIDELFN